MTEQQAAELLVGMRFILVAIVIGVTTYVARGLK